MRLSLFSAEHVYRIIISLPFWNLYLLASLYYLVHLSGCLFFRSFLFFIPLPLMSDEEFQLFARR